MKTNENFAFGWMRFQEGVLTIQYYPNTLIDEGLLINQIVCRKELLGSDSFYMIVDLRNAIDVTTSAMMLAAENPHPAGIKAIALVTNSGMDHTRAKLYSVFDRPNITTKAFLSLDKANEWFESLENENYIGMRKAG